MTDDDLFFPRIARQNLRGIAPLRDIALKYGLSYSTMNRLRAGDDGFPSHRFVVGGTFLYDESEVARYMMMFRRL